MLDFGAGIAVNSLGHCHPHLVDTLKKQAEKLWHTSNLYRIPEGERLAERLCEATFADTVFFTNSGAEAMECSIKMARKYHAASGHPEKFRLITFEGAFHGRTLATIAAGGQQKYIDGFGPAVEGFDQVPFADHDAVEKAIGPETAGILIEPIQGEGGIVVPPDGYLQAAAELCRKHNVLLIADEIQTGLGRTGKMLACEHEGVQPDGLILGKALGGGIFPVSMFLAREEVMAVFQPGDHGSTFGGNPLGAAIGLEALNILVEDRLPERSAELGDYLVAELRKIDSPLIREIRGRGLFVGVDIDPSLGTARSVCEALMQRGLLSKETHQTVVRLAPPLVIEKQEIDWALQQIREVLAEMDRVRLAS